QGSYRAFPGGNTGDCKYGRAVCPAVQGIGEYQLIFDTVNGVPHQGVEMLAKTVPTSGHTNERYLALYLMDGWRPTTRLTLNLGLRWERELHMVPAQSITPVTLAGFTEPLGVAFSRPKTTAAEWNMWAPRAGVAFDLFGNGRTVLKGTYG